MRRIPYIVCALTVALAEADAQELYPDLFDARGYVDDLNVVAENWGEAPTNTNVRMIASVSCATLRKLAADELFLHLGRWIASEEYPEEEIVAGIELGEFMNFELNAFKEAGATEAAMELVELTILEKAQLRISAPSFDAELPISSGARERFCGARALRDTVPEEPADDGQLLLASSMVDTAVGIAMMSVDAAISVGSGGADAAYIAILSGGVGYDLTKRGLGGTGN
jgi:hypothetical protein